jgi:glycolate oxidase FAD binding subunit
MTLQPANLADLTAGVSGATLRGEQITAVDLRALNRVTEYTPEDMTVTVEAGLTLAELQTRLAQGGQWLPSDPPHPGRLTIDALLATNASGPRRFGYGTIREHLIGLKAVLADGRVIMSGGRVVKNVAGYDLLKLFVGARGSLGVIVEATFKLRPRPEAERFVQANCNSAEAADTLIQLVLASALTPMVLDWHTLAAGHTVILGFAGSRAEVEWQIGLARELGVHEPATLDHEQQFWSQPANMTPRKISVLPSHLSKTICQLGNTPFVARAGNGVLWHCGETRPETSAPPNPLARRLKETFDPRRTFPDLPA